MTTGPYAMYEWQNVRKIFPAFFCELWGRNTEDNRATANKEICEREIEIKSGRNWYRGRWKLIWIPRPSFNKWRVARTRKRKVTRKRQQHLSASATRTSAGTGFWPYLTALAICEEEDVKADHSSLVARLVMGCLRAEKNEGGDQSALDSFLSKMAFSNSTWEAACPN